MNPETIARVCRMSLLMLLTYCAHNGHVSRAGGPVTCRGGERTRRRALDLGTV